MVQTTHTAFLNHDIAFAHAYFVIYDLISDIQTTYDISSCTTLNTHIVLYWNGILLLRQLLYHPPLPNKQMIGDFFGNTNIRFYKRPEHNNDFQTSNFIQQLILMSVLNFNNTVSRTLFCTTDALHETSV